MPMIKLDCIKNNKKLVAVAIVVLLIAHEGYHLWF